MKFLTIAESFIKTAVKEGVVKWIVIATRQHVPVDGNNCFVFSEYRLWLDE